MPPALAASPGVSVSPNTDAAPMASAVACEGVFEVEEGAVTSGFFSGAMDEEDDDEGR